MKTKRELTQELKESAIWTALLTLLFLLFNWTENSKYDMLIALPFFSILYYIFFSIGKDEVSIRLRKWINYDIRKVVVFPAILIILYLCFLLVNKQNPFKGTLSFIPYLFFGPLLIFFISREAKQKIDWLDFTAFVIFLLPTALFEINQPGNLPFNGNGFDSVSRIVIILTAVYAYVTIRGLTNVGFIPVFQWKFLWRAIWVWFVFYLVVITVGFPVKFVKIVGHDINTYELLKKIALTLVVTFLHTAIFEELFFRGILQNMLTKRIGQSKSWKTFLQWGLIVLLPIAVLVGYTLKGEMKWFPALITLLIFSAAFIIERAGKNNTGVYTALAITSVIFGLVHYHSGAIIYIGFACIAGWAYGYTYIKTKNVFYSAIVHTLVNCSALIFGLELVM